MDEGPSVGPQQPQNNGKAIPSLVLGILGVVVPYIGFIMGIIAIILGKNARQEIDQSGEAGRGMATAGFICGIVGLCFWAFLDIIVIIVVIVAASTSSYY